jgi:four helix bundle protein
VGSFRDLVVYRRAARLADEVHRCVHQWPEFDRRTVGIQVVRAADSVAANIAEACARIGKVDQRRMFRIARGSAFETEQWLERAHARGLQCPDNALQEAGEISRMLGRLQQRL